VCLTDGEVEEGLAYIFEVLKSSRIVVEEMLTGPEASFFVVTDGEQVVPVGAAHDYKRLRDGNVGPNTGGMGSVSPTPYLSAEQEQQVMTSIVHPLLQEMKARGTPYTGFLYVGLMIGDDAVPKVIEFNVRLGDPECQALMRRIEGDLFPILFDLAEGAQLTSKITLSSNTAVVVVQASHGYPAGKRLGDKISGVAKAERLRDVVVFHAGTAINHVGELVTNGGRVLTISAVGNTLDAACTRVYEAANQISFEGQVMRRDIGRSNSATGSAS
jgi:phosphoribosylamine--glycine ligase